ncbi:MAG: hypothetical protein A2142_06285 [candidate division Zixibacteria bacterium RBG_16_48_11]|nr:MAG: hypothetical protein A2142_06285 [candidate division Zixibacteria bacterium RBG_16_48_11]
MGIAHPTGYPLYTLLGKIFTWLPFGTVIQKLNFLSALFISAAVLIYYFILRNLYSRFFPEIESLQNDLATAFFSLFFAFTPTLWSQATTNEVYGLHILFVSLILFLALKWEQSGSQKILYLICFLYGLSFTNHMTSILLLPAMLFFGFTSPQRKTIGLHDVVRGALLFCLALTLYLYLPVRSLQEPLFDWSNPQNWSNFKNHVTGWQYQVWMIASSGAELSQNLERLGGLLLKQFPPVILGFPLSGLLFLLWRNLRVTVFLLLLALTSALYGINYKIADIENYYLPLFLVVGILTAVGVCLLVNLLIGKLFKNRQVLSIILILTTAGLALFSFLNNYPEQNKSTNYFAYDLAGNVFKSVTAPALVLTDIWDFYSPYLYLHYIEEQDTNVIFLDKELLRRSWYCDYVRQAHPEIYRRSKKEIAEFVSAVRSFELKQSFDPGELEQKYQALLLSLVERNLSDWNIYLVMGKPELFREHFLEIPEGLVYRLYPQLAYYPYHTPEFELRGAEDPKVYQDGRTKFYLGRYAYMLEARAKYETYFGHGETAAQLNQKARQLRAFLE